jgi:ATP-dependent DNA helicase RecQ
LREKNQVAAHFHAGLPPDTKKYVQQQFIQGGVRVIVATNAFGMGIDKPDVRLVIHADIPGSLENYLQEAGRAGRDRQSARCVLLFTPEDVERQFGMSARSRLTQREIQAILKSLRNLDRKKRLGGEVVATAGEILSEDDGNFVRDSATDDTRVRTAISWLEEATLLLREENRVQIFPSSLRVGSLDEARKKLDRTPIVAEYKKQLLLLIQSLFEADSDEGISTDELMGASGLSAEKVRSALFDLERLGIANNDTALTAFVHSGVERSSLSRFEASAALEAALIDQLQEAAPDLHQGDKSFLHLRHAAHHLKEAGHETVLPEKISRIVRSLASDGRGEDNGIGSIRLRRLDSETMEITLQRGWPALTKTARLRRAGAERLLQHLLSSLPSGHRGTDLLAETTLGNLLAALEQDMILKAEVKDMPRLLDRALLWLHEQEVIRLNKGLAVFRPAMTIHLGQDRRGFLKADFAPLKLHYAEQVVQIHVMAEYVQRGLKAMTEAVRLAMDYFSLERDDFISRWLPDREKELSLQTTPQSWRSIVEDLNNPAQQRIVADDREQTNVLVLAGPGSGKTRALVHRIAYLLRVKRENPRGVLALAYNRHAAVEIRKRLVDLIGDDSRGVTVLTCHGLAMRLVGVSFAGNKTKIVEDQFTIVLEQAVALLKGEGLAPDEADEQRERLLAGFRWILVDEYQDIGPEQYELIDALAGRTLQNEEGRLNLFAVGDDDQNIYAFAGASVEFIRRFESDYKAKPSYLVENYRSTANIINTANLIIETAPNRMKASHPIEINRSRAKSPRGGDWQNFDPIGQGRVQILPAGREPMSQAVAVMVEFKRMSALTDSWNWSKCAVIAREWKFLDPVRSFCELNQIPVEMASEDSTYFWRLREVQELLDWLKSQPSKLVNSTSIESWLDARPDGPWWQLLREAIEVHAVETNRAELPVEHFREWLAEWGREIRRRQSGLLLLTAHRAKGLEFDHVAVLDGRWDRVSHNEDSFASRRLYYVAMTRARKTLVLARFDRGNTLLDGLPKDPGYLRRSNTSILTPAPELSRRYRRLRLRDVDLGFAGRYYAGTGVHRAIAALSAGDSLQLQQRRERWELLDNRGLLVGRLAKAWTPPKSMVCVAARVMAVLVRRREDSDPEYMTTYCCDRWELVLPELVFEATT